MSPQLHSPLFAVFASVLLLLVAKAQILAAATAATRGKLKKFPNEEDAQWLGGEHSNPDDTAVQRIFRAHRNDLEALLPFLAMGAIYVASGASYLAGIAYFGLFLFARYLHTFAYLTRRARLRRDAFTLAWLLNFAIGGHAVWAIFSKSGG